MEYNKGDCDTKSVISITTEKTTAIKCQFEGVNDDVRNSEFSFKIKNVLVTFFPAHKGFQETAVIYTHQRATQKTRFADAII